MKKTRKKEPVLPKVGEIIAANAMFEQAIFQKDIVHMGQKSLRDVVTNCGKRLIGSQGGLDINLLLRLMTLLSWIA